MDPSAPLTVAKGTALTSAAGALLWGIYGSARGTQALGLYASSAAISSIIAGATFFSIREYVVSPLLVSTLSTKQYIRRREEISRVDEVSTDVPLTFTDMRLHKVPDTFVSGAITGAVLSSWKFGKHRAIPGAVTAGLICGLLHLTKNEFKVQRVAYVSRNLERMSAQPVVAIEPKLPWPERVLQAVGFQRISDEQYIAKMVTQRDVHLTRIRELELEIEEEQNRPITESTL